MPLNYSSPINSDFLNHNDYFYLQPLIHIRKISALKETYGMFIEELTKLENLLLQNYDEKINEYLLFASQYAKEIKKTIKEELNQIIHDYEENELLQKEKNQKENQNNYSSQSGDNYNLKYPEGLQRRISKQCLILELFVKILFKINKMINELNKHSIEESIVDIKALVLLILRI